MGEPSPAMKRVQEQDKAKSQPKPKPWDVRPADDHAGPAMISAVDLFRAEFPPPRFVVDGLIGDGLTVLAGKPKGGKSWLALLFGWAVAAGVELDGRATWQGEVLYIALEDTKRRLQTRMKKLHAELGWVVPETLTISTAWPRAGDGGLYYVAEWLAARKNVARLVIVDVLAKFRKPQKGSGNNYADDYEAVGGLKDLVDHYETSALFLHHTRKLRAEDPFDELSGTYGIIGPADTIWVLDGHEDQANLYVRGRDIAESTVPMKYTRESGRWVLGQTREGIDTSGRAGGNPGETRAAQARAWLKGFLKTFAYPAKEIDAAGVAAGYSPAAVKNAKAELGREGTGELWFRKDGAGQWWAGLGSPDGWKRRPTPCDIPE